MNTGREKEVVAHAKLVRMIEAKIPDCVALQVHRTKYGDTALRQVLAQYMRCEVHTLEKKVGQYAWSVEGPKRGTGGRGPEGFAKAALLVLNAHSEELSRLHASEQHAASGRSAAEAQSQLDERRARDVSNAAIEQQNAIDRLAFAQRQAAQARLADQPLEYLNAALAAQEASRAALANGGDDESEGGDDSGEESDEAGGDEELALEPAAGAGAMHGDDAGGAVEANEGGDQTGGGQCGNDQSGAGQSGADESSGASDEAAGGGAAALKAGAPSSAYAAPIERPPQPDPRDPSPFRVVALPSLAEAALAAAEASTSAALAELAVLDDEGVKHTRASSPRLLCRCLRLRLRLRLRHGLHSDLALRQRLPPLALRCALVLRPLRALAFADFRRGLLDAPPPPHPRSTLRLRLHHRPGLLSGVEAQHLAHHLRPLALRCALVLRPLWALAFAASRRGIHVLAAPPPLHHLRGTRSNIQQERE